MRSAEPSGPRDKWANAAVPQPQGPRLRGRERKEGVWGHHTSPRREARQQRRCRCRCDAVRSCERRRAPEQFATYPPFSPRLPPPPSHLHHHPPPPIRTKHTGKSICDQNPRFPLRRAPLSLLGEKNRGRGTIRLPPSLPPSLVAPCASSPGDPIGRGRAGEKNSARINKRIKGSSLRKREVTGRRR